VRLEYSTDGGTNYNLIADPVTASLLSYSWSIPDAISTNVKVKISDSNDTAVYDESDSAFKIKGGFDLTSPNGNESWIVASAHDITWTTHGTVNNVKLEYSTDAGSNWNLIVDSAGNNDVYSWTIPDAISTQCRVRVSDVNDSSANDSSDNNFKIRGDLIITSPNGGERWAVGTTQVITWDRIGSIAYVMLDYSDNGGTTFVPVTASTPNSGSYSWAVPDAITTHALVKVTDASDLTVTDTSDTEFKIQGSFTVTSPNGGEAWLVGSSHDITWSWNGSVSYVKLEYSTDGGTNYNLIADSVSNNGTYTWQIPDNVSGQVRVKVSDTNDAEANDTSNADFRIRCAFTLTAPNGGEQWHVGRSYNITWSEVGTIADVKLEYSRDNFLTDINTISAAAPNTGMYSWTIPDSISDTVRVRVSDPNDIGAYDISNADFRITADFTVTNPNGGENWEVNSTQNITWNWAGTVPQVKLEYSTDGGADYSVIAAPNNTGSYAWDVPDDITDLFKVRVSDLSDSTANDVSDDNAKIVAKFTVTSPNGGEIWTVADSHDITWDTVGTVSSVNLYYSLDDFATPVVIDSSVSNTGTYFWTIPDALSGTSVSTVKVRVRDARAQFSDVYDTSDSDFKIRGAFVVTSPNGGERWEINQVKIITWNTIGTISDVKIIYSTDSGTTFPNTIVSSTANNNFYNWTVPDDATPSARIRIIDVNDSTVYDTSDADFRIQGYFTLTSPNGGEAWIVGSSHNITWTWGGTIANVKLSYSTDSGATFPNIISALAPNGAGGAGNYSFLWVIPDDISFTARVKIEDPNDNTVFDISDGDFKIRGDLDLTAPNGGERWVTREDHTISWTTTGTIPTVKLEYSKDGFVSDTHVIVDSLGNSGNYAWSVPDDRSATVKVKVSDTRDGTVYDSSADNFTIDYYSVTFQIRDLITNQDLSQLTVDATSDKGDTWQTSENPQNPGAPLGSPVTVELPYGFWTATWSKTGYGDKQISFLLDKDNPLAGTDNETIFMETTAIHIWKAYSDFAYDPPTDTLSVSSWLERDGFVVTGGVQADVYIYDPETGGLVKQLTDISIDSAGFFNSTWNPTTLIPGKVYTVVTDITNASGAHFKTPASFTITAETKLQDVQDTINAVLDKPISEVNAEIQQTLQDQTDLIDQKMEEQKTIIETKTDEMIDSVNETMTSFETQTTAAIDQLQAGADQAVEAGQELEATAKKYSWKAIVSPNPALSGEDITLQVQGPSGLYPMVNIYSWDNQSIIKDWVMVEASPGLYTFSFNADTRFTPGKAYTYTVSEQTTGGLVSGSGSVEEMSMTTIAGLASAAPEAERAAKKTLDMVKALEATIGSQDGVSIAITLKNLQDSVESLPEIIASQGTSPVVTDTLNEISDKLNELSRSQGYDLSEVLEEKLSESPTIKAIRKKTDTIEGVLRILQALFEAKFGGKDAPIVSTVLQ